MCIYLTCLTSKHIPIPTDLKPVLYVSLTYMIFSKAYPFFTMHLDNDAVLNKIC